jgi:hypothetical protein
VWEIRRTVEEYRAVDNLAAGLFLKDRKQQAQLKVGLRTKRVSQYLRD